MPLNMLAITSERDFWSVSYMDQVQTSKSDPIPRRAFLDWFQAYFLGAGRRGDRVNNYEATFQLKNKKKRKKNDNRDAKATLHRVEKRDYGSIKKPDLDRFELGPF